MQVGAGHYSPVCLEFRIATIDNPSEVSSEAKAKGTLRFCSWDNYLTAHSPRAHLRATSSPHSDCSYAVQLHDEMPPAPPARVLSRAARFPANRKWSLHPDSVPLPSGAA